MHLLLPSTVHPPITSPSTTLKSIHTTPQHTQHHTPPQQQQQQQHHPTKKELYNVTSFLGDGSSASVYSAKNTQTQKVCALKIFDKAHLDPKMKPEITIGNEVKILKKLKHPNIVTMYDVFETKSKVYIVMELASGGDLWNHLCHVGYYCEAHAARMLTQLLNAVDYLHQHQIVHRDIKPENLLFSDCGENARLMLTDFGLATMKSQRDIFSEHRMLRTVCGTAGYMAPEILKGKGYKGFEADIWSVGMVGYFMICGMTPFDQDALDLAEGSMEPAAALLKQYKTILDASLWDDISKSAKSFISHLLYYQPGYRPTAAVALQHEFLVQYENGEPNHYPHYSQVKHGSSNPSSGSDSIPTDHSARTSRHSSHSSHDRDRNIPPTNRVTVPLKIRSKPLPGVFGSLPDVNGKRKFIPIDESPQALDDEALPNLGPRLHQWVVRGQDKHREENEACARARWQQTLSQVRDGNIVGLMKRPSDWMQRYIQDTSDDITNIITQADHTEKKDQ